MKNTNGRGRSAPLTTPLRGTSRQTSHISVTGDVADVDVDVDVDVADATSVHG